VDAPLFAQLVDRHARRNALRHPRARDPRESAFRDDPKDPRESAFRDDPKDPRCAAARAGDHRDRCECVLAGVSGEAEGSDDNQQSTIRNRQSAITNHQS
jgi:hypothetical protein